ncbi:MAG: GAF domain-containing protein [Alphaproteobacteria bacterium]|nr:GAF domain-containing protein [Alphaproteobacteria bacterium]
MITPSDLDIVRAIFEHRSSQADLDPILQSISSSDRQALVGTMTEVLQRVATLVQLSHRISDNLSLDQLFPELMGIVTSTLDADRATLFLLDPETGELFSRVAQGDGIGEIRIPHDRGIAGAVFSSGAPAIINDPYSDPRFNPDVDRRTGYRTRNMLCDPVISRKGDVIGVAQVLNKRTGEFSEHDLDLLTLLTGQAAAALENARLHEAADRALQEETKLLEITSAITSELNLPELLQRIVAGTTDLLDADRSSLFLYDAKTDELWSYVAEGMATKQIRFPASGGVAGACFASGQVLNIPDAYADSRFNQEFDRRTGYRTRSILCMPILNKEGRRLGVMQVLNKRGGPFAQQDERRIKALAAQAAIALENAQLFEAVLNARNYNESILKSLSNGVVTLDAERRVIKVNEAACRILGWEAEEKVGHVDSELFGDGNAWIRDSVERVAVSGDLDLTLDTDVHLADGSTTSVNLGTYPLIDIKDEAIGYMLVLEDISREKRVKTTMSRYMPKEIVDQLMQSGDAVLGGSLQDVSILFSDIRSFTTISEKLGARGTVSMLNDYFTDMVEVILSRGGVLDKYIGDAIMALFGTPFKGEMDADNSVAVANEMMVALHKLNARRLGEGKEPIEIGIGVATGEVVAGNIGSPKRMDYTVIGDSVNIASRLEGANKFYGSKILICDLTARRLKGRWRLRELDLIRVKGKTQPLPIFEALDYHDAVSFPNYERVLEQFDRGIGHYRQRNWLGAIASFEAALALNPNDAPTNLYLDRCRYYLEESAPGDDWDGVFTMQTK